MSKRILIAAKHPPGGKMPIGGVQSWCSTVATQLEKMGHHVVMWGPEWPVPSGPFDAGIFSNIAHTVAAVSRCERVVTVAHGVVADEEPASGSVVYTSEEVRTKWSGTGPVVRQPIDLNYWTPEGDRGPAVVFYGYRPPKFAAAEGAAKHLGLPYCHLRNASAEQARQALRKAAVVLATGRAALEAMACGAPTVIADHRWPYQGPLMDTDIHRQMSNNYSGRGGVVPTASLLVHAIAQARSQREHVERHHDARRIAEELLCLLS